MDKESLGPIIESFYRKVGIERKNGVKTKEQYMPRAAIMCALVGHFTYVTISSYFDTDHYAVVYARKKHESNMLYWKGYHEMYVLAQRAIKNYNVDCVISDFDEYLVSMGIENRDDILDIIRSRVPRSLSSVG